MCKLIEHMLKVLHCRFFVNVKQLALTLYIEKHVKVQGWLYKYLFSTYYVCDIDVWLKDLVKFIDGGYLDNNCL